MYTIVLFSIIIAGLLYCLVVVSIVQSAKKTALLGAKITFLLDELQESTKAGTPIEKPGDLLGKKVIYIGETTIIGGVVASVYVSDDGDVLVAIKMNLNEPSGTTDESLYVKDVRRIYVPFNEYGKTLFLQEDVLKTTTEV